ncbi:DUF2125 domain-containing protein [Pseudooceanicola sp. C21-150M6]|uniref:DUF2125 domain-containing protein n=1 Tax=Pseudooceanicola sp. C21-150M6 TaxID=3434355 RepID=UPI003D7F60A8
MKRLFFIVIGAALLWSGWWVYGASQARNTFTLWFEQRRAEGWVAEYDDFALRGYPNRFDATWQGLSLADPDTGLAWDLPIFQILALAYQPYHLIAVGPHEMTVATPYGKYDVTSDVLRASLRLSQVTVPELERAVVEGHALKLSGAEQAEITELHLAAERQAQTTYRYGVEAQGVRLPASLVALFTTEQSGPPPSGLLTLDATVTFDRPWDITALDVARPQPQQITLTDQRLTWAGTELRMNGALDIDPQGVATGDVSVKLTNWEQLLTMAETAGWITAGTSGTLRSVLGAVAASKGRQDTLDADLTLRNGGIYFGVFPIAAAPVFRLR